ncbi:MAG: alpha/beta hydrolase [Ruminiclostridium sp.]|nr:alpha/beta hydrolase [Ruminiclostridium sp.]
MNGLVNFDGGDMYYVSFGHGSKNLIVLPGLSDGLATVKGKDLLLRKPYKPFFGDFTVYMFSRRNSLPREFTLKQMAEDQAAALRALGIEHTSVLGVSQGGVVAQYLAAYHPELVDKLVLAVTTPNANDIVRECVTRWIGFAEEGKHKEIMIDTAEKSYSEAKLKKYRKMYPFLGMVGKPSDYARFLTNARALLEFDVTGELGKITAPTLIIGGAEDHIVGVRASRELNEGIAGSELYIYDGLGHAPYEEAPDFYDRGFEFLRR